MAICSEPFEDTLQSNCLADINNAIVLTGDSVANINLPTLANKALPQTDVSEISLLSKADDTIIKSNQPLDKGKVDEDASADFERWSSDEYTYAGSPRFTLNGKLPYKETHIVPLNFALFTGTYLAFMVAQHVIQMKTIWKEQGEFKFYEDGRYAMYADKAGHIFGCLLTSYAMTEGFLQSGLSWEASTVWGTIMGLSYSTYVEILDGYGKGWGFSPSDFYADITGAAIHLGQHFVPFLQNFTPKFQYFPAQWHGERSRHPSTMFIDDYSSHSLWLSVNVHNLLPTELKSYWPSWLELSFGYAVRGLCDKEQQALGLCQPCQKDVWVDNFYFGSPRYMISLDYNIIDLLPNGGNFVNWIKQTFNYFKFPSPTIEFGPVTKFYLAYPFHFEI